MLGNAKILRCLAMLAILASARVCFGGDWDIRGDAAVELRVFPREPQFEGQDDSHLSPSLKLEPEVGYEWNGGNDRIILKPFFRLDKDDDNRTHFDLRELNWLHLGNKWTLQAGNGKVFWGVTESRHLVDIINQDDQVEDVDGEDKLGQPMINLTLESEWGAFDFFYLPFFRERTFPDDHARLRGALRIDENPNYESGAEEFHPDWAARWSNTVNDFDVGVAFFYGTSREPRFIPSKREGGDLVLRPFYDIVDQTSLDLQWTKDAWLLKLEAMTRGGQGDRFFASVSGFEYTIFQVFESAADLGLLAEYLYDGRDKRNAPSTVFDNDFFSGVRLALNDVEDTTVLGGTVTDLEHGEVSTFLEVSRRIGQRWLVEFESRWFLNTDSDSPAFNFRRDGFFTIRLSRFF